MTLTWLTRVTALLLALSIGPALAAEDTKRGSHSGEARGSTSGEKRGSSADAARGSSANDHSAMTAPASGQAVAKGVVNSIDMDTGVINVTHEPVEALGWPTMTMDLATTRRVDLSAVKAGEPVTFTLKQGRDKQFRVIAIEPAPATN
ncbi:MAG: copper-binding protein [Pseudomonadota bacterium]